MTEKVRNHKIQEDELCKTGKRELAEIRSRAMNATHKVENLMSGDVDHITEYFDLLDFVKYAEKKFERMMERCGEGQPADEYRKAGSALNWWFG